MKILTLSDFKRYILGTQEEDPKNLSPEKLENIVQTALLCAQCEEGDYKRFLWTYEYHFGEGNSLTIEPCLNCYCVGIWFKNQKQGRDRKICCRASNRTPMQQLDRALFIANEFLHGRKVLKYNLDGTK